MLATTRHRVPQDKFSRKPYNKSFIDQACSVKMAGYWLPSFLGCLWTSIPSWSLSLLKRTWPISSHLDQTSFVNNPYIYIYIPQVSKLHAKVNKHNRLHFRAKICSDIYPWTYLFLEQIISADKYPRVFSRQMEAIVYIIRSGSLNQHSFLHLYSLYLEL